MNLQRRDLKLDEQGEDVRMLHDGLSQLGLALPATERERALFGKATQRAVVAFQRDHGLEPSGIVDAVTAKALSDALGVPGGDHLVTGRLFSANRAGLGGLKLQVVDKNAGPDRVLAKGTSDDQGSYSITYGVAELQKIGKRAADLQVRALAGDAFLAASEVRYGAKEHEQLDIKLPDSAASALPTEFETLTGTIGAHYAGPLRDLEESAERQDLTYLANKTGWDARAVAMAALADRFSASAAKADIAPAYFYALFRAGLPANEAAIFQADPGTVARAWKLAAAQGVIPAQLADAIPAVAERFRAIGAERLLDDPAVAGVSSLRDRLAASGIAADRQSEFADLYSSHQADMGGFWSEVAKRFDEPTAKRLQRDGKLGLLTINNAPLVGRLSKVVKDDKDYDPIELARSGYYRAEPWLELLSADVAIPSEIPGDDADAKRANYAEYLAAQVRLSYPTAAIGHLVGSGQLAIAEPARVASFLDEQSKFEFGMQPIEQYLRRNQVELAPEVVGELKRLQRVYQITPSDQAMGGLLKNNLDAAYHIVRYDKEGFTTLFADELGGQIAADRTYDRAVQVHNAVLNVALSYLTARSGIALGAEQVESGAGERVGQIMQPAPTGPQPADAGDVIAYPTLESLFGEMDFCACEHCRSILSPAAYLVDLLYFIDQPPTEAGKFNPQTVLFDRRPDLQSLPLTCENTNTALPYIDIVNETLEYFIANSVQALSLHGYLGHDTDAAASEDLMASPEFVLDSAYTVLREQRFPAPLPFHQPLENQRRYFSKFGVPLELAMERLRQGDDLERGAHSYGWRDILMEALGLSRPEHETLTDSGAVPLWRMYGLPAGTTDAAAIATLSNARDFTRRLDISYEDLVELLQTRFVNPYAALIPKVARLGLPFATIKAFHDGMVSDAALDALLPTGADAVDPTGYGGDVKAWLRDPANYARIMSIITLADPSGSPDPCGFDTLELRYSRPLAGPGDASTRLGAVEYIRLLRLVRLWKRTGWTIEQTDAAIDALYRIDMQPFTPADIDSAASLDAGFLTLLPRLGVVVRVLRRLNLTAKRDLLSLLACWAPIRAFGASSLYRQMFLNPALLAQDPVFADNGYGEFLTTPRKLTDHTEAVRSAFNLTGGEYQEIVGPTGLNYDANTDLTIANISSVFRYGYLARKLRLSLKELRLLVSMTGMDPFAAPDVTAPAILGLAELVQNLKDRSLKSVAALYLIWNQDLSGKSAPAPDTVTEVARLLRGEFAAIDEEFAATEDPGGDVIRARTTLVYGEDVANDFLALLDDSIQLDVPYTNPQPQLDGAIVALDARLAYDDFRHRLSHAGLLDPIISGQLKALAVATPAFVVAIDSLVARGADIRGSFFARHPELRPLYDSYTTSAAPIAQRRAALLAAFRPELSRRRKRQQALLRLSGAASMDVNSTQALLDPESGPYPLHALGHPTQPALDDVVGVQAPGLSAEFYFRDTATGAVDLSTGSSGDIDYAIGAAKPLPANPAPASAVSGIWTGRLEVPESGFYNIVVETDAGSTVKLSLDGADRPLTQNGTVWRNSDPLELRAGNLPAISVTAEKIRDRLSLKWETPTRAREVIPGRYLYSRAIEAPFSDAYIRFLKVASLAATLRLSAAELAHLAGTPEYQIGGESWLNALPAGANPTAAIANALVRPFSGLLDFARIKASLSPSDDRLLVVLTDPAAATASPDAALYALTKWQPSSIATVLGHLGVATADLSTLTVFRTVYEALGLVDAMGIPAAALLEATTNEPTSDLVRGLQGALRARYALADWRSVVQPINDELRDLQRNALVAYVLHQMRSNPATAHIDTPDKLFEYFLMDVEMDPCMPTSRIRHALSSVQLFIERCLMNLEPRVSPRSIVADQWVWMKRYRVWEANRKVFLFPENWLEPELRDDKSPFFKEIESELLQADITDDSATAAVLNYLAKLEDIAKLEPVGFHYIEADPTARRGEVNHVIARTAGARRTYYYRRLEFGYWTPWEQIKLDIEGNPVIPYVWNGRLLLFWLRILKEAPVDSNQLDTTSSTTGSVASLSMATIKGDAKHGATSNGRVKVQAVLCWSEYFNGKWQAAKTSDVDRPTYLGSFDPAGANAFDRSKSTLYSVEQGDTLRIWIGGQGDSSFVLYNTHSAPVREEEAALGLPMFDFAVRWVTGDPATELAFKYVNWSNASSYTRRVLKPKLPHELVRSTSPDAHPWNSPFFYWDRKHVFYVTTNEEQVSIGSYIGFGIEKAFAVDHHVNLPPIVLEPDPLAALKKKVPWGGPIGPDDGVTDPLPMRQLISEDAFIRTGIGTAGNIRYGDREIGPTGQVATTGTLMREVG